MDVCGGSSEFGDPVRAAVVEILKMVSDCLTQDRAVYLRSYTRGMERCQAKAEKKDDQPPPPFGSRANLEALTGARCECEQGLLADLADFVIPCPMRAFLAQPGPSAGQF